MKLQFNPSTGKLSYNSGTDKIQASIDSGPGIPGECSACWADGYTPQGIKATVEGNSFGGNGEYILSHVRCDGVNADFPSTLYVKANIGGTGATLEINRGGLGGQSGYENAFFLFVLVVDNFEYFVGQDSGTELDPLTTEEMCNEFKNDATPNSLSGGGTVTFEELYT